MKLAAINDESLANASLLEARLQLGLVLFKIGPRFKQASFASISVYGTRSRLFCLFYLAILSALRIVWFLGQSRVGAILAEGCMCWRLQALQGLRLL